MHSTHQPASAEHQQPSPAQTLRAAAGYLQRHGWTQGQYRDPRTTTLLPPACAHGAITFAVYGRFTDYPYDPTEIGAGQFCTAVNILDDYLNDHLADTDPDFRDGYYAIGWNDAPGRTADEVIAVLNAAADDWDRIHGGAR